MMSDLSVKSCVCPKYCSRYVSAPNCDIVVKTPSVTDVVQMSDCCVDSNSVLPLGCVLSVPAVESVSLCAAYADVPCDSDIVARMPEPLVGQAAERFVPILDDSIKSHLLEERCDCCLLPTLSVASGCASSSFSDVLGNEGSQWLLSDEKLIAGGRKKIKKETDDQESRPFIYRGPRGLPEKFVTTVRGRYSPNLRMPTPDKLFTFNHISMTEMQLYDLDCFSHLNLIYADYCVSWSRVNFSLHCPTNTMADMFLGLSKKKLDQRYNPVPMMSNTIGYKAFPVRNFVSGNLHSTFFSPRVMVLKLMIIACADLSMHVKNFTGFMVLQPMPHVSRFMSHHSYVLWNLPLSFLPFVQSLFIVTKLRKERLNLPVI